MSRWTGDQLWIFRVCPLGENHPFLIWLLSALNILQEPPACSLLHLLLQFRPWLLALLKFMSTGHWIQTLCSSPCPQSAGSEGAFFCPLFLCTLHPYCALSCLGHFSFPSLLFLFLPFSRYKRRSHCVAQSGFEFLILRPLPLKC